MMRSLFEREEKGEIIHQLKIDLISRYYPLLNHEIIEYKGVLNFDVNHLLINENIKWNQRLIEDLKDKLEWDYIYKIKNCRFNLQFFDKFEQYINFHTIGYSESMVWSKILIDLYGERFDWSKYLITKKQLSTVKNLRRFKDVINWSIVSRWIKLPFTEEVIEEFKDYWDWKKLSSNPHLPIYVDFIKRYIDKLDFDQLSKNPSSLPLIYQYPNSKRWNWFKVIVNRGIEYNQETFDFLFPYFRKHLEGVLSRKPKYESFYLFSFLRIVFLESQKDLSFFLNKKYLNYILWDVLSRSSNTKYSFDFINIYKSKLNFKELNLVYSLQGIITTDFIIENKELFDPKDVSFYNLPLTIELLVNHYPEMNFHSLSNCQGLNWNWDFIEEHIYEFNSHILSRNKGIYTRLIENSMSPDEVFSLIETSEKYIKSGNKMTNNNDYSKMNRSIEDEDWELDSSEEEIENINDLVDYYLGINRDDDNRWMIGDILRQIESDRYPDNL